MSLDTKQTSADKDNTSQIVRDFNELKSLPEIEAVFDALPYYICILNEKRQLVYSNESLLEKYNLTLDDILGKRHGELFNCINSEKETGGCGTSENCKLCGAVNVVLLSQKNNIKTVDECRILAKKDNKFIAYDFLVSASPFYFENRTFTIITLEDISEQKRKRLLEKLFFHDVLNTAGSLNGLVQYINSGLSDDEFKEIVTNLSVVSKRLIEEILSQRDLTAAENGELKISVLELNSKLMIKNIIYQISFTETAQHKSIELAADNEDVNFVSDNNILQRVLSNMVKNALEATPKGGKVTIGSKLLGTDKVNFWVLNHAYISPSIQSQIFQRNFSIKGTNRGLGTFSMKIFGENYLKGQVSFLSDINTGTIFSLIIPILTPNN
ncbi:MAG: PAS domain-containing sensor histidine kinase [bacterium]